jgi:hypothetical protein
MLKPFICALVLGSFLNFAWAEGPHTKSGPAAETSNTKREVATPISVCSIKNVNPDAVKELIAEGAVACTAGKKGEIKIPLTAKLLGHIKGQVFLEGDPCKAADPDAPPSPPGTGYDELLAAACTIEMEGQKKSQLKMGKEVVAESRPAFGTIMKGLKVDTGTLGQLTFSNVFTPYSCVPRRIHK